MGTVRFITGVCAIVASGCATAPAPSTPTSQAANVAKTMPLILERSEGERRTWRELPEHTGPLTAFLLKVDPKNGGSKHLVFLTEELPPGEKIEAHRHPSADELLFLQSGTARIHLGDQVREVHAGATVFIPADTWISVDNIGSDAISLVGVFSAPGFEEFMRAESVRAGEPYVPLTKAEDDEIQRKHAHAVIYR